VNSEASATESNCPISKERFQRERAIFDPEFFDPALQKVKDRRQKSGDSGEMASTTKSEK